MKKTTAFAFALFLAVFALFLFSCGGGGGGGAVNETFTISYNANGAESGSVPASQHGDEETSQAIQSNTGNLAKSGYLFDGWNTTSDGSGTTYAPGFSYKGNDLTLYAKWAAIFEVEEIGGGSPAPAIDGVQKALGSSALKILGLTAKGRTLTAIDIPSAIDGNSVTAIGSGAFQDCSFITNITIPATVTSIEGNAFAGCSNLTSLMLLGTVPPVFVASALDSCPATVYVPVSAVAAYQAADGWDANPGIIDGYSSEPHTVTFDSQGANTPASPATMTVNPPAITVGTLPAAPKKTGYNFGGWFTEPAGAGVAFTASTPVTSDMTVYAKWDSYSYTVTFNDQEADIAHPDPSSKPVNSPATTVGTLPSGPAKTGLIFGGWYTQTNGGGTQFTASTPVTDNITVYAYWVEYSYTVTFDDQGADITHPDPASKTVNSPATTVGSLPTPPEKTNFDFGGWYTQTGGAGSEFTAGTTVTGNITVYAKWIPVYTVTFNDQGANVHPDPATKTVTPPATTIDALPTPPQKTDYFFGGWYTGPNGAGEEFTASTVVTESITVYAKWVSRYSSTVGNRTGASIGDIVLSNKATITPVNYTAYASALSSEGLAPVGVVAYMGGTIIETLYTTKYYGSCTNVDVGTSGKVYMVGLLQSADALAWAPTSTTGFSTKFSTEYGDGSGNWQVVKAADGEGTATAELIATNYPAFNYANSYTATGYASGWYLPALAELKLVYINKETINNGFTAITGAGGATNSLSGTNYWSSSQDNRDGPFSNQAAGINFGDSNVTFSPKGDNTGFVRVVRALDD